MSDRDSPVDGLVHSTAAAQRQVVDLAPQTCF